LGKGANIEHSEEEVVDGGAEGRAENEEVDFTAEAGDEADDEAENDEADDEEAGEKEDHMRERSFSGTGPINRKSAHRFVVVAKVCGASNGEDCDLPFS
jgi:hypothetical protein